MPSPMGLRDIVKDRTIYIIETSWVYYFIGLRSTNGPDPETVHAGGQRHSEVISNLKRGSGLEV